MRKALDVDIMNDEATLGKVALLSAALLAPGALGALAIWLAGAAERLSWAWLGALVGAYVLSLPVHELVHGAFFRALGGPGVHVRFGFKKGMLYATCPGQRFPRRSFTAVLLAPLAVLTCAYAAIGALFGLPLMAWLLVWLHASGCAGDLYFAHLVARHPEAPLCEDTEVGFAMWAEDNRDNA